jgi:hypothetical protein
MSLLNICIANFHLLHSSRYMGAKASNASRSFAFDGEVVTLSCRPRHRAHNEISETFQLHIRVSIIVRFSQRGLPVQHVQLIAEHHRFVRIRRIFMRLDHRRAQIRLCAQRVLLEAAARVLLNSANSVDDRHLISRKSNLSAARRSVERDVREHAVPKPPQLVSKSARVYRCVGGASCGAADVTASRR